MMSMHRCEAKPYEGDEPFIFVSYSHKDMSLAVPIISHLASEGYRIWYDEGIDPGTEWVTNIAEHLSKSSAVIAFLSPNSIESHNCREEIIFARDANIPVLGIHLTETQLDSGLKLALASYQMIYFYTYENVASFYARVEQSSVLLGCREEAPAVYAGAQLKTPELAKTEAIVGEKAGSGEETEASVDISCVDGKQASRPRTATPRHAKAGKAKKHMSHTAKKATVGVGCAALAVVIAVLVGVSAALSPSGSVEGDVSSQPADQEQAGEGASEPVTSYSGEAGLDQDVVKEDASLVTTNHAVLAMLDDPDSYRGEILCSYACVHRAVHFHASFGGSSAEDVFGENHVRLSLLPSEESICIPESEASSISSIDENSYFLIQGTLDAVNGDAYLRDISITPASYFEAMSPALVRWDNLGSQEKSGITVSVDAVCFAKKETRVWYTVSNSRSTSISFDAPTVSQNNKAVDISSVSTQGQVLSSDGGVSVSDDESRSGYVAYAPFDEDSFTVVVSGFADDKLKDLSFELEISPPA